MRDLAAWLARGASPSAFPYRAVLACYQAVGKHRVATEILVALDEIRHRLPAMPPTPARQRLERFLHSALDKFDGRYDYRSYLALTLLALPARHDRPDNPAADRLVVQLIADALAFELRTAAGQDPRLPQMRPSPELADKRLRHGLRSIAAPAARQQLSTPDPAGPVAGQASRVCRQVQAQTTPSQRLALQLSMLPVDTVHDEYLFIRVLQAFETVFARLVGCATRAIDALGQAAAAEASEHLDTAAAALHESAPLFSLLATMQAPAFHTFRERTQGASAIQSTTYKLFEALCRPPDPDRLDSPAYRSVPEVRTLAAAGQPTIDGLYRQIAGDLPDAERARLDQSMGHLAGAVGRWRQTHYRLAVRMLGHRPGTGYTQGTPYLDQVRGVAVFESVPTRPAPAGRNARPRPPARSSNRPEPR